MISTILKWTFRSFYRSKSTFLINLIGLSTGLACALLIYIWINNEIAVDKFLEKESIPYQLIVHYHTEDGLETGNSTPCQLAETLVGELPEIEHIIESRLIKDGVTLSVENNGIKAVGQFAGSSFFELFPYHLLHGDKKQVLRDKNSIVISEDLALRFFNTTENIIGKTIKFQQRLDYQVSGIYQSPPANASLQFDFVLPFEAFITENQWALNWNYSTVDTYLSLTDGTDLSRFNAKIAGFLDTKRENQQPTTLEASRYTDHYLFGEYENGVQAGGRIQYVRLFGLIAIFILLIACVNFMNLSTAKASRRLKEVGVKKVVGASRKALIFQFLAETILLAFLSLGFAAAITWCLLPAFEKISGKDLLFTIDLQLLITALGVTLVTGLIAGSYPAFYLSGFRPAKVLKGSIMKLTKGTDLRRGLVVFQFVLSIIMIVSVLVIYQQINYLQTKNLGYSKDRIIQFDIEGKVRETLKTFLVEANQLPAVEQASSMGESMVNGMNMFTVEKWKGEANNQVSFQMRTVDFNALELFDIDILEGRTFSEEYGSEENKIIFNEAAIKFMGLEAPIGEEVSIQNERFEIIGVTKDFHFASLHEPINPLFFVYRPSWNNKVMIKSRQGNERLAISQLEQLYQRFNPGFPFEYQFLDQEYESQYVAEQNIANLSKYFAALAILLSCLGLFGLSIFNARRRVKEIGIRKVLGASTIQITTLLTKDFVKLVTLAILIASPLAFYLLNQWLKNFAYHINIQWWIFAVAGLCMIIIAFLTVGFQSLRAALVNPVNSLRNE